MLRPQTSQRKGPKPSDAMLAYLAQERQLAAQHQLKWRERGPRNEDGTSDQQSFRGQRWRAGSQRYANRGGKKKVFWAEYHRAISLGFSEETAKQRAEEAQALVDKATEDQAAPRNDGASSRS